jgi:riboflavin kinase/FMN adenylyltransferase
LLKTDKTYGRVQPTVATIGFFDGVHCGHRFLIQQVKEEALRRGLRSMLVTFSTHPARVLRPDAPIRLLTTSHEKAQLLGDTQVDEVAMLPFTPELAALSARQFMEDVLLKQFHVRVLVIGYDHRFGHDRTEGFGDYVRIGRDIGIDVVQANELQGLGHVSSSAIRRALTEGRVEDATTMLGRPYTLGGTVVRGHHVGTTLGFPTANLRPDDPDKLIPMNGVYAVQTEQGPGMLNIGTRPTLDNGSDRSIEVHLFDFADDLYDQHIILRFLRFVRNEKKFATVDELQKQLQHDERACRQLISCSCS